MATGEAESLPMRLNALSSRPGLHIILAGVSQSSDGGSELTSPGLFFHSPPRENYTSVSRLLFVGVFLPFKPVASE